MFRRAGDDRVYRYDDSDGWEERREPNRQSSFQNYPERYPHYPEEEFPSRDFYNENRARKFPVEDDFQSLRQRYDEDY